MDSIIITSKEELELIIQRSIQNAFEQYPSKSDDPGKFLNLKQASELINLAEQTIYGLTSSHRIPFLKKGKKLYFKKSELEEWLSEGNNGKKSRLPNSIAGVNSTKGG